MNNAINKQAIEEYLSALGRPNSENYLYAYIMPSNIDQLIFGPISALNIENLIVAFYKEDLVLIPLTLTGDFASDYDPLIIPKADIADIKIKKGLMQYTLTIVTAQGDLKLKLSKKILGQAWQGDNIKNLEANNWFI